MKYRAPWVNGEWAPWLRGLRGKAGVYIVREAPFLGFQGAVLYVGEAHGGKRNADLYKTITRHMQSWSGPTAGQKWSRDEVVIATRVLSPDRAKDEQAKYINALRPKLNELLVEEVPF